VQMTQRGGRWQAANQGWPLACMLRLSRASTSSKAPSARVPSACSPVSGGSSTSFSCGYLWAEGVVVPWQCVCVVGGGGHMCGCVRGGRGEGQGAYWLNQSIAAPRSTGSNEAPHPSAAHTRVWAAERHNTGRLKEDR
jgi:hypothetical protein